MSNDSKAVFLSYASQDAEAARRICEALRAAGVEVWFDQSELRGGDAWDAKIRKQIKECALFVPIISANTQARTEGYFRLEWRLADQRTHLMAKGRPFLVPVVIDDTRDHEAHVPDSFFEVQWTRLGSGQTLESFAARIRALLNDQQMPGGTAGDRAEARAPSMHRAPPRRRAPLFVATALAIAAAVAALWFGQHRPAGGATAPAAAVRSNSRAEQLATQAIEITERLDHTRDDLVAAEVLAAQAVELEPNSARMWGMRAWVNAMYLVRTWDVSAKRREQVEAFSRRALALDANEPDALTASAQVLSSQGASAQAEAVARQADRVRPHHWRTLSVLATALAEQGRAEDQRAVYEAVLQRDPTKVLARYGLAQSHMLNRRGRPTAEGVDRALLELDRANTPRPFLSAVYLKATYLAAWRGDLAGMREMLDEMAKFPVLSLADDQPLHIAMWGGLLERRPERTLAAARLSTRGYLEHNAIAGPKAWSTAMARMLAGQAELARVEWAAAEAVLRERLQERPAAQLERLQLGVTLAWLGRADEAREMIAGMEPLVRESRNQTHSLMLALYHTATGNARDADPFLRIALNRRGRLTDYTLPIDPWWDRLRGKPEFEALLAEAAERREEDARIRAKKTGGPAPAADSRSIAVLAFRQLSADPENEYLCEAISDELCNVLGRVPRLRVAASASAFTFKSKKEMRLSEIAAQLGVTYLVNGSVQKIGNRVRVRAELIKAADETRVWGSDTLDHELKDMFAVQDAVVAAIAKKLELNLGTDGLRAKTINPEAYRLYLEGRQAWATRREPELLRAEKLYQQALELDPHFPRAMVGLADVWQNSLAAETNYDRAEMQVRQALSLDPQLAEAHASLGALALQRSLDFAAAGSSLRHAISLNPNYASAHQWLAMLYRAEGRLAEAFAEMALAAQLDPLSPFIAGQFGWILRERGQVAEALASAEKDVVRRSWNLAANCLLDLGRTTEATERAEWAFTLPEGPLATRADHVANHVVILARAGQHERARVLLASVRVRNARLTSPQYLRALASLEERDEFFARLDEARVNIVFAAQILDDREIEPMRSDPRFQRWLDRVGLREAYARMVAWRKANPIKKAEVK